MHATGHARDQADDARARRARQTAQPNPARHHEHQAAVRAPPLFGAADTLEVLMHGNVGGVNGTVIVLNRVVCVQNGIEHGGLTLPVRHLWLGAYLRF